MAHQEELPMAQDSEQLEQLRIELQLFCRPPDSLHILSSARCPRPHSEIISLSPSELSASPATLQAPRILSSTVSSPDIPRFANKGQTGDISTLTFEFLTVVQIPCRFFEHFRQFIGCNPVKIPNKVDFLEPFTPNKPTTSPPESEKSTSRSTFRRLDQQPTLGLRAKFARSR